MRSVKQIIALVFDFDDTLVPDSTSLLLESRGIKAEDFWEKNVKALVKKGYDPTIAYLNAFLGLIGTNKPLGTLTNNDLRKFGATLERNFFPGLKGLICDLRKLVKTYKEKEFDIEFYIISGGLKEIIIGCEYIRENFKCIYGSELAGDNENSVLKYIKRAVTFTEKTRFLFEINKGITSEETIEKPYAVNKFVESRERRIPWPNFIYIGDGQTDIPCFSLIKANGGSPFLVFDPSDEQSAKRTFLEFLKPQRVLSVHAPKYRKKDDLGSLIRTAVSTRCNNIIIEEASGHR